jgi:hypothetical protein
MSSINPRLEQIFAEEGGGITIGRTEAIFAYPNILPTHTMAYPSTQPKKWAISVDLSIFW